MRLHSNRLPSRAAKANKKPGENMAAGRRAARLMGPGFQPYRIVLPKKRIKRFPRKNQKKQCG